MQPNFITYDDGNSHIYFYNDNIGTSYRKAFSLRSNQAYGINKTIQTDRRPTDRGSEGLGLRCM